MGLIPVFGVDHHLAVGKIPKNNAFMGAVILKGIFHFHEKAGIKFDDRVEISVAAVFEKMSSVLLHDLICVIADFQGAEMADVEHFFNFASHVGVVGDIPPGSISADGKAKKGEDHSHMGLYNRFSKIVEYYIIPVMLRYAVALVFLCAGLFAGEDYDFRGKHLLASYSHCDSDAMTNIEKLQGVMLEAAKGCGATVLGSTFYLFPGNGMTMVILLSESHASIHTYPEHGSCFVDLFTCGNKCSHEKFDAYLRAYLKPAEVNSKVYIRHQGFDPVQ